MGSKARFIVDGAVLIEFLWALKSDLSWTAAQNRHNLDTMVLFECVAQAIRKEQNPDAVRVLQSSTMDTIPVSRLGGAGDGVFAESENARGQSTRMETDPYAAELNALLHFNTDEVLPSDARRRGVWSSDRSCIVGVIVWSPTQPFVWAFRYSWAPPRKKAGAAK